MVLEKSLKAKAKAGLSLNCEKDEGIIILYSGEFK